MSQERILWVVAVLLVGAAAFFGGRQMGVVAGQDSRSSAQQEFFAQRGGGQGGAGAQTPGGRGQGVSGTVESIDGGTVSLKLSDGSTVKVSLAADGVVRHQVDGTLADLTVGERVVAIGQRSGDTVTASAIQAGGAFGGAPGAPGAPGANRPNP
ncbi:hypothetical protein K2Z83_10005 [Oscillochloris sp. ZM17-4]|uniref:hypothetical protein n=1 Tax=Oscillochloris sp. ZM17-4 TaxID=2866714 RepID=UPI001C732723|nr:hypothetical protein [Oscillochloris sp. ZM17-4]MBX0328008.1 hypothetical protein [Oscillochloris sp. ZM17-4]